MISAWSAVKLPVESLATLICDCTATVVSQLPVLVRQLEGSGGSFTALLAGAPTGKAGYIDSGDVLEEHERRAGGLRIRMKHYFKKQATQQSGPPIA